MASNKETVLERLRRQRVAERIAEPEKLLADWKSAVESLFNRLRVWLTDAVNDGLFRVETYDFQAEEPKLGTYDVPGLKIITPTDEVINVRPKARLVVGAYGRVDLDCAPNKAILVQSEPGRWQFASLDTRNGWTMTELSEDSFWEALQKLIP